ncbi:DUF4345 family protein [Silanimonas sp.]|jgi:hypothetical protein|uniref:DUF4345 family protein n=1 Tax=Silanimonas sp. TaxID=1929290 RepID=UPI0022BF55D1|nr:DUF4345 family protein [Silanimonas sp.]MCZ8167104.1 DUF4345 family protein [Silanimonas sp.]
MQDLPVILAIAGFTVMGVGAIAKPAFVTAQFGILELTPAGRNEVRAVYGGFGIFMAIALLVALRQPELRNGILITVAAALGGMAAGRLVSAAVDRAIDRAPLGYLALETVVAVMLLAVA